MRRHRFPLCLWLVVHSAVCASPLPRDRPASGGAGGSIVRGLEEGVTGRITDEGGRGVEGAAVLAASVEPGGPAVPEIAIVSDASGRYEWPLRAGRYELTAAAEGYQRTSKRVIVQSGRVATLDFVLQRERAAESR